MNPSASGWINKFGHLVKDKPQLYPNLPVLYDALRATGFLYGINVRIPGFIIPEHILTEDEKAKINLLSGLYFTYRICREETGFPDFLNYVLSFYEKLKVSRSSFFTRLLPGRKTSLRLEQLIGSRVYLEDNLLSKTFNTSITNSLLFIDVLTFKQYLEGETAIREHAQELEYITINLAYNALSSKKPKKKDKKLAQVLETSLTFIRGEKNILDSTYRERLINKFDVLSNRYFLDVACLTVWEDQSLEFLESSFIYELGRELGMEDGQISLSLAEVNRFFLDNEKEIPELKERNLAGQFYEGMARIVKKLIQRNKKRLQKELSQSKELVYLLSKSTRRELSPEEKRKVYKQLLEIFKSIPSLAIFLLPGGALLLPLFVKFIPQLLPSSFDENRVD